MSDEEEDYMSDKFLASLSDVRPSLIQDRAKKRQVEVTKKQHENNKRQREEHMERSGANRNEKLQESLSKPIEAANKGFQMLAKMGYKPGKALGKEQTQDNSEQSIGSGSSARLEPIGISLKLDRGGLGREAALQELAEKRRELRIKHLQQKAGVDVNITTEEYRRRATQKAEERFTIGALSRCQRSCETLDTQFGVEEPEMHWFWPERLQEKKLEDDDKEEQQVEEHSEDEEEEDQYSPTEKLELLLSYLRTSYAFCFWCGVHYKDQSDMNENCPGLTRDDH